MDDPPFERLQDGMMRLALKCRTSRPAHHEDADPL